MNLNLTFLDMKIKKIIFNLNDLNIHLNTNNFNIELTLSIAYLFVQEK